MTGRREVLIPSCFQKSKKEAHTMRRKQNIKRNALFLGSIPMSWRMKLLMEMNCCKFAIFNIHVSILRCSMFMDELLIWRMRLH
jgi:hypothetical protein